MGHYGSVLDIPKSEERYTCHCVDGKCSGCGECCTDMLPLTSRELQRIRMYAKAHNLQEHRQAPFFDPGAVDFTCPFRDQEKRRCDIYPVRPEICRSFICTKALEVARADRDKIYQGRREHSLRYEVFDNPEVVAFIAGIIIRGATAP